MWFTLYVFICLIGRRVEGETAVLNFTRLPPHFKIQLFEKVTDWIVTPVGEKVLSKSGVHLGNRRPKMRYSIVLPLLLRFAFYRILIFCVNPLYIASDTAQIVIVLFFSMSSGWIYSCCFMLGPELCKELKHKEATSLLLLCLPCLLLGSVLRRGLQSKRQWRHEIT
jgi:hypothetical protein